MIHPCIENQQYQLQAQCLCSSPGFSDISSLSLTAILLSHTEAKSWYQHAPVALRLAHPCAVSDVHVCVCVCVYVPAGFPATAYGPVAAAAVAAARGSGRGARGRGGYLAYPQSTGPGKRSVHVLCGCCSLQLLLLCFSP